MLRPSYSDILDVITRDNDDSTIGSRYTIVIAAAKRARQIVDGSEPLVAGAANKKALSTAVQELYEQKVSIMGENAVEEPETETVEAAEETVEE